MQQLLIDGRTKEQEAIDFIRKHEPPEGYFLGYSGGKDSEVLMDIAKRSGVEFKAYYSATGIDPPELVKHIRTHHRDVTFLRPKTSMWNQMRKWGYPTKFNRWCCDRLKKEPAKNIPLRVRLMGIRAEESARRRRFGRVEYAKRYKVTFVKPIFDWLEWEIWEYIDRHCLPYCSLYDEGFSRLGCVVCPFLCRPNTWDVERHKARWPLTYKIFEKVMREIYNNPEKMKKAKSWCGSFDEFLDNWYRRV